MGFFRKKEKEMNGFLRIQSLKPDYVDPEAFTEIAETIIKAYLSAVYSQEKERIPMKKMEENFYYRTAALIDADRARGKRAAESLEILSLQLSETDIRQQYAIKSVSYDVLFSVSGLLKTKENGEMPYEDQRLGIFTFLNDKKLGWILSGHEDYGRRPN